MPGITPLKLLDIRILQPQRPLVELRLLFCPRASASPISFDFQLSKSRSKQIFLVVSNSGADELDPPPDTGISSSVKSAIFLFFFPDFAPPLGAAVAALFSRSRAFRLSPQYAYSVYAYPSQKHLLSRKDQWRQARARAWINGTN